MREVNQTAIDTLRTEANEAEALAEKLERRPDAMTDAVFYAAHTIRTLVGVLRRTAAAMDRLDDYDQQRADEEAVKQWASEREGRAA